MLSKVPHSGGKTGGKFRHFFKQGCGGGFHCEMRLYPTNGIASALMVNSAIN
jgi:hypothetical protein